MRVQRAQIFQLAASDGGLTIGTSGHTISVCESAFGHRDRVRQRADATHRQSRLMQGR
jgi:hypothetical protein